MTEQKGAIFLSSPETEGIVQNPINISMTGKLTSERDGDWTTTKFSANVTASSNGTASSSVELTNSSQPFDLASLMASNPFMVGTVRRWDFNDGAPQSSVDGNLNLQMKNLIKLLPSIFDTELRGGVFTPTSTSPPCIGLKSAIDGMKSAHNMQLCVLDANVAVVSAKTLQHSGGQGIRHDINTSISGHMAMNIAGSGYMPKFFFFVHVDKLTSASADCVLELVQFLHEMREAKIKQAKGMDVMHLKVDYSEFFVIATFGSCEDPLALVKIDKSSSEKFSPLSAEGSVRGANNLYGDRRGRDEKTVIPPNQVGT